MSHYYYATYISTPKWVAIFQTQQERDEWVSFRDAVSNTLFEEEDKKADSRIALTPEQAYIYVGNRLYNNSEKLYPQP